MRHWLALSDLYTFPHVTLFDSWEHLLQLLRSTDLQAISDRMARANRRQLRQLRAAWRRLFLRMFGGRAPGAQRVARTITLALHPVACRVPRAGRTACRCSDPEGVRGGSPLSHTPPATAQHVRPASGLLLLVARRRLPARADRLRHGDARTVRFGSGRGGAVVRAGEPARARRVGVMRVKRAVLSHSILAASCDSCGCVRQHTSDCSTSAYRIQCVCVAL
eukprot:377211-Prymnesium_polylepis.1